MRTSESIAKVTAALVEAQTEIKNMLKDKEGYGYKYVQLSSILDEVKPIMQKHKLAITQFPVGGHNEVGVTSMLVHESGEFIEESFVIPLPNLKGMNDAQAAGAVITYARRYAVSAILNLASDTDIDAASAPEPTKADVDKERSAMLLKVKDAFELDLYSEDEYRTIVESITKLKPESMASFRLKLDEGLKKRREAVN